jgi:hypothetical protein
VELAAQQRRAVVVLKLERHVAANDGRCQHRSGGWVGVYFDLDGENLLSMGRQAQLVEQPHKAQEGAVDDLAVVHPEFYHIALGAQF